MSTHDLHGNVPDKSPVALLLIDVINDLDFDGGEDLLRHALPMAHKLAALKRRAAEAGIPTIYVNDNFGRWRSDFTTLVEHCIQEECRGKPLVDLLAPEKDDYFVLKPKHSAFYSTTLETLLAYLGASTLILGGVSTHICVLFTAHDAYMRDFKLYVPRDCVAAPDEEHTRLGMLQLEEVAKADTRPSDELDLEELLREAGQPKPQPAAVARSA